MCLYQSLDALPPFSYTVLLQSWAAKTVIEKFNNMLFIALKGSTRFYSTQPPFSSYAFTLIIKKLNYITVYATRRENASRKRDDTVNIYLELLSSSTNSFLYRCIKIRALVQNKPSKSPATIKSHHIFAGSKTQPICLLLYLISKALS